MSQVEMDNFSFFDQSSNSTSKQEVFTHKLDVVRMEFSGADTLTWQELFSGYDTIHAITFSSGIGFVCELLNLFEHAEIIFGCDEVISYSLQEILAYQAQMVELIRETSSKQKLNLISRIEDNSLRLYVARNVLSHEKLYLLSAADGRKRVIMGSANMSFSAFGGVQRENICYLDGEAAYDWYIKCYQTLRDNSTDEIVKKTLLISDAAENIEELPIARTVRIKKALVLEPAVAQKDEVQFALDVKSLAAKYAPSVPRPDKRGKLELSPGSFKTVQQRVTTDRIKEKRLHSQYPQLEIFPDKKMARLNGETLDLHPPADQVKQDVSLFVEYMDGYKNFHGNVAAMQRRYFEFANWFFCSPLMATMRDIAERYDQNRGPYPVFGLIYGQSKAGKTSFLETLLKMMIGQKVKVSATNFTRTNIQELKRTVRGAPIIVDDLTQRRFNEHAVETIKDEDFGISEHLIHYPAVVISANEDVKAVKPEVVRRTVICHVSAGVTTPELMRSNVVRTVQRKIGTAFYREYLGQMLEIVPNLLNDLQNPECECPPDILAYSSQVMLKIFSQHTGQNLPQYMRPLCLEDYFNERVTASYALKVIRSAWKINQSAFEISERENEMRYNSGDVWEAERILKELPETLEAHKSREWVIMNLTEARAFFRISLKKSWIPWKK